MSLTTYLLIPVGHETAFKQEFFRSQNARCYSFLPEHNNPDLLNTLPQSETWQPVIIQQYSTLPTLLDKNTTISSLHNHKVAQHHQQQQDKITVLEQCISNLQSLKTPFGFGVLDLGNKHGWRQHIPITALLDRYQEATLYWFTP